MIPAKVDTDVLVIGGGPAGLAAAVGARRRGLRVMLADGARPPIRKACGEGLMPDGAAALAELGFPVAAADSFPFRGIRFVSAGTRVQALFPAGCGLGICRTALHETMRATAERVGVDLQWGAQVTAISPDGSARLGSRRVTARWIIGADGLHSRVRAWADLDHGATAGPRFAFRRHYRLAPWSNCMELHWGDAAQLYLTPVSPQQVCVVVISRDSRLRLDRALAEFPEVEARWRGVQATTAEAGAVTIVRRLPRVTRGPVALIGDAAGSVDAITGQGLYLAFCQARALAHALAEGALAPYEAAHRKLIRRPALMSALLLALERHSWLRRRTFRAFASRPALFETALAAHLGAASPLGLAANGLAIGWHILAGHSLLMRGS
jgi:menaquinone-9 beta-reductase